jgi:hypothetical protein
MRTIDLAAFTSEYLINTWLQPSDFASSIWLSRLNGFFRQLTVFTALKRGVNEKSARKEVAMNSSLTKLPYAAAEISGRRYYGKQIGLGDDAPRRRNPR